MVILPNFRGIALLVLGFGIACAIDNWLGLGEGPRNMIAGSIVTASDLTYRLRSKNGHIFEHDGGGSFFFIPMWCLGIVWVIFGIVSTLRDQIRNIFLQFVF